MGMTRRQFGIIFGAASAVFPQMRAASRADAVDASADVIADVIMERRVYNRVGAVPPASVMQRCGMKVVTREEAASEIHFTIAFASLAERTRAWDRFNSDSEWCALRERRPVRLREMTITSV